MQVFKKMTQAFYNLDIFVREHVKQKILISAQIWVNKVTLIIKWEAVTAESLSMHVRHLNR